jgi:ABC-2 type transport system permease protein
MHSTLVINRRELASYFATPLAYVFIVIFLALAGTLAFFLGSFFERGQDDLQPLFNFLPWLYLVLIPALAMRLWAEERKSGTIELFLTLPISISAAVIGKFLAAWEFAFIPLILTFPFWITVNYLGHPDNGVVIASYVGAQLMAGAFLAVGGALSALSKNQVIAFVVTAAVCFLLTVSGSPIVLGFLKSWAPQSVLSTVASFSVLTHFNGIVRGVLDLRDVVFFLSVIALGLFANALIVDLKKAD